MKESVRAPTLQRGKGGRRSRPRYRLLGGGVHLGKKKKKERDKTIEHSLCTLSPTEPPPAPHPQQRHIPLNNGHFDQRGIPVLRLSLSLSRQSTGAKDEGHTGYSVSGILIGTQWSLTLCQLCVCVLKHPLLRYMQTRTHTHTHSARPPNRLALWPWPYSRWCEGNNCLGRDLFSASCGDAGQRQELPEGLVLRRGTESWDWGMESRADDHFRDSELDRTGLGNIEADW